MNNKKRNFTMPIIIGLILILFVGLIFITKTQQADALAGLPNYTEVKGDFTVNGLEYEKQPHLGDPAAKVKVVEFADFKCPVCKSWEEKNMETFKKQYIDTGKVELFFINYAFLDRDSYMAASAGEAIAKQNNDKFWEYYTKLYANQGKESEIWATQKFILDFVKKNIKGIDYAQFEKDVKNHTYMYDVKKDYKIAGFYGVNGTPKFMVNGKLLPGNTYDALQAAIEVASTK
jgi:protein-disulfide isomerase